MQIQTALFFETPEEIFARVFSEVRPGPAAPEVAIIYRRYANANSRIRYHENRLEIVMSDLLAGAPAPVVEALAWILISKLFRKAAPAKYRHQFRLYLNRKDVRRQLHLVREIRGRKRISGPQGEVYNLETLFEELNQQYFGGLMARPNLGWSPRRARTLLGHFDASHNAIILSRRLDAEDVPPHVVAYVLYHEMLHLKHPVEHRGARRCVHGPEFRAEERKFAEWKAAKEALKHL